MTYFLSEDTLKLMISILSFMIPFLFSISFHEAAHALFAYKFGDPTAKFMGRISLNPLKHADIFGTFIFPILGFFTGFFFGWAKPVPVNPYNLKHPKIAIFWISLAGPLSNFLLAFLSSFVLNLVTVIFIGKHLFFTSSLMMILNYAILLNLALCFFNLIPLFPLDGSKILARFLPDIIMESLEKYSLIGFIILLLLVSNGTLGNILMFPISIFYGLFNNISRILIGSFL